MKTGDNIWLLKRMLMIWMWIFLHLPLAHRLMSVSLFYQQDYCFKSHRNTYIWSNKNSVFFTVSGDNRFQSCDNMSMLNSEVEYTFRRMIVGVGFLAKSSSFISQNLMRMKPWWISYSEIAIEMTRIFDAEYV